MGNLIDRVDRVEARFLNAVNDAAIGGAALSVIGSSPVAGQLGKIIHLTDAEAAAMSLTTTGTLRGGLYQYVQFKSGSTAANARGQLVFWSDLANYVVTPDSAAGSLGLVAGVTLNVVTKGYYGWIQIAGRASVLYQTTVTDATSGNIVTVGQTTGYTADAIADASSGTALTNKITKSIVGIALDTPVNASVKLVLLDGIGLKAL